MSSKYTLSSQEQDESFLSDDIDESLWDSPAKGPKADATANTTSNRSAQNSKGTHEEKQERDVKLRQELESVRKVNEAIEGVIESLDRAKSSMKSVNQTVTAASSLLNTWTRILSQTEHNQRLILDPSWQGASQDIADIEREAVARQQAAERREVEEQERRTAAARKAEEDERRRADAATKPSKPVVRGRGRVGTRGSSATTTTGAGYVAMGGSGNTSASNISRVPSVSTRKGVSGIGRGMSSRGRGRGS